MSKARDLVERLAEDRFAGTLDWPQTRNEIHEAHEAAETEAERVLCLSAYKVLMDTVERQRLVKPDQWDNFRKARREDYRAFLIREAMIGVTDGHIHTDRLAAVTRREVAAGRLSPDDDLRKLADAGDRVLTPRPRGPRDYRGIITVVVLAIVGIAIVTITNWKPTPPASTAPAPSTDPCAWRTTPGGTRWRMNPGTTKGCSE